ncbi:unnamed protein product [Natator depressus]
MENLTRLLSQWLWLLRLIFASQQQQDSSCTSSGTLPAAEMFLGTISANEGDTVSGRCLIPAGAPVSIVFFCKDGMEISRLQARRGKFSYDLAYSVAGSSGNISCGYMSRNDNNQVLKSLLSVAQYLKVTGASSRSSMTENPLYQGGRLRLEAIGGIAGLSVLCLAPLIYLLVKKVSAKQRCPRKQLPNRSTENTPTDEQILFPDRTNHPGEMCPFTEPVRSGRRAGAVTVSQCCAGRAGGASVNRTHGVYSKAVTRPQDANISEFGTARASLGAGKRDCNIRRRRESPWKAQFTLRLLKHKVQPALAASIDSEMAGTEETSGIITETPLNFVKF